MNIISIFIHHRGTGGESSLCAGAVSLRICGEHGSPRRRAVCTASARGEKKNYNCHLSFVTRSVLP